MYDLLRKVFDCDAEHLASTRVVDLGYANDVAVLGGDPQDVHLTGEGAVYAIHFSLSQCLLIFQD